MKYKESRYIDPSLKSVSIEDQMVEAMKIITNRLTKTPAIRGYRKNLESFTVTCHSDPASGMLRIDGEITHSQRGYTREEMIEGMAEAFMDWDKAREERDQKDGDGDG